MDQGLTDQNSEKRDFSPADVGDAVDLVDKQLEQQSDAEFHGLPRSPERVSAPLFPDTAADLVGSGKTTMTAEDGMLPVVNKAAQDVVEQNVESTRPKRISKPSEKLIANRLQADTSKLERLWEETTKAISKLQGTPYSIEALRKAVGDLRSAFNECQLVWVSLMDFTAHASMPEQRQERQTLEEIMRTRKEIVQAAINEGIDRKNDLVQEFGSVRSGSRASRASISSSALRAHARGEAAAALKKAELQKKIIELQSKSAIALELEEKKRREDEIAFVRRKLEEQARLESLRAEQQAAVAVARAKAIDQELGLAHEYEPPDLPVEEPGKRVEEFINSQLGQLT